MHGDVTVWRKRRLGRHNNGKKNQAKKEIDNSSDHLDYTKLQLDCSLRTTDRKLRQPSKNSNWRVSNIC